MKHLGTPLRKDVPRTSGSSRPSRGALFVCSLSNNEPKGNKPPGGPKGSAAAAQASSSSSPSLSTVDSGKIREQNDDLRRRLRTLLSTMNDEQKSQLFSKNPSLLALMNEDDSDKQKAAAPAPAVAPAPTPAPTVAAAPAPAPAPAAAAPAPAPAPSVAPTPTPAATNAAATPAPAAKAAPPTPPPPAPPAPVSNRPMGFSPSAAPKPAPQTKPATQGPSVGRTEEAVYRFNPRVDYVGESKAKEVEPPARAQAPTTTTRPPSPGLGAMRPGSPPTANKAPERPPTKMTAEDEAAVASMIVERRKLEEEQGKLRALEDKKKAEQRKAEEAQVVAAMDAKRSAAPSDTSAKDNERKRAAAAAEIAAFDPATFFKGKAEWLYTFVPAKPVAGEPLTIYFNRVRSEALRTRGTIQLKGGYNDWEVEMPSLRFAPAPNVVRDGGQDWWCARIDAVPRDTYNLSFVLTDTQGAFENNNQMDFVAPIEAGVTKDEWLDLVLARELEREKQREEEEAKKREEERIALEARKLEEDRSRARNRVQEQIKQMSWLQGGAPYDQLEINKMVVWEIASSAASGKLQAGASFTLFYNIDASPLKGSKEITVKMGYNSWKGAAEHKMTAVEAKKGGTWFSAELSLPEEAVSMNFVFYNEKSVYDNNSRADYKASVELPAWTKGDVDVWAKKMETVFEEQERTARLAAEEAARRKVAERDETRRENREKALAVLKKQMKHIVYTEPMDMEAGQEVTIYYNPRNTVLSGHSTVFIRGGFNRWSHRKTFGPIEMKPPRPGAEHYSATITLPREAFKLDFVFSDTAAGSGTFDNRGGYDYHLPVKVTPGLRVKEPALHVVHVAVEMAPIAKVGGLGDVVTSLGRAIAEEGHLVEVILPKFKFFDDSPVLRGQMKFETEFDWGGTRIYVTSAVVENLRCFFVEPRNGYFDTPTVYGRYDDGIRFDFFCKAALEFLIRTGRQPDILHCHDWSTASVAKYFWEDYQPYGLSKPRVVFTIHNLEFGQAKIGEAAMFCQRFTTVSPTYAYEIGGHPAVRPHTSKFVGIRNGIDPELWNPADDMFLPVPYTSKNHEEGKKAARRELRKRVNLTDWQDRPIVGVVTRLTAQKGMHLIKHSCWRTLDRGGQFVLLGSAPDPRVQADFANWAQTTRNEHCSFNFAFDEPLSHLIYAACDFVLVPSMFEPCGLTQLIAMRYGAIPVVRHTGGLRDTVFDVDCDKPRAAWDMVGSDDWQRDGTDATNGFAFDGTDAGAFDYAMNRAFDAYYNDPPWFRSLQARVMDQDWSWSRPALDYVDLYFASAKRSA